MTRFIISLGIAVVLALVLVYLLGFVAMALVTHDLCGALGYTYSEIHYDFSTFCGTGPHNLIPLGIGFAPLFGG